jgi:LmbE family N-acetylglucosaminyl deacetylase
MDRRRRLLALLLSYLLLSAIGLETWAEKADLPPRELAGAQALGLLLRRLQTMGTVLFMVAHPDDENNALCVALSRGLGVRTVLLTATRGEGGQNEIGPELGESLGILRGEELGAIHRLDGVEQRFARAYDFGFSFSVDETMEKWGQTAILEDFVRAIRLVRPDVILTLPRVAKGGGQHHQAAGRLAALAFRAAADAKAFPPAALGGLEPWQASRVYEGGVGMGEAGESGVVAFETARMDPLLGTTWFDYGGRARSLHRTQGMTAPRPESGTAPRYTLIDSEPPEDAGARKGLLDGIDVSWRRLATFASEKERPALALTLATIEGHLQAAGKAAESGTSPGPLDGLRAALGLIRRLREEALVAGWEPGARLEILSRVEAKETECMEAIALAHGLGFEATADDADVVPGQALTVVASITNGGADTVKVEDVALQTAAGWTSKRTDGEARSLAPAETLGLTYAVHVGDSAAITRSRGEKSAAFERYEMPAEERDGPLFGPPPLIARLFFTSGGLLVSVDRPVVVPVREERRLVTVVPEASIRFVSGTAVVARRTPRKPIVVQLKHYGKGAQDGFCRIVASDGWTAAPAQVPVHFTDEDQELTVSFELQRPTGPAPRNTRLHASIRLGEKAYGDELQDIDYPHTQFRRAVRPAALLALALHVRVAPDQLVGYVAGKGDRVPEALDQLGVRWAPVTAADLASGDLSRFRTIVSGVRAYQSRPELKQHHDRLLEYVKGGGHVVVQYNKFELNQMEETPSAGASPATSPFTPYPAVVSAARITDETAPVRVLLPAHPLLNIPNRIGASDFAGWVQERGLYFLEARDPRYEELLAASDPFPENAGEKKGMLVSARVGAGRWTYVGLGLWRQLQAGTPGAYRILANLVSQPVPNAGAR